MKFKPVRKMSVCLDREGTRRDLGMLAWSHEERRAYFEHSSDFLDAPLVPSIARALRYQSRQCAEFTAS
jgi:hypothetical protein